MDFIVDKLFDFLSSSLNEGKLHTLYTPLPSSFPFLTLQIAMKHPIHPMTDNINNNPIIPISNKEPGSLLTSLSLTEFIPVSLGHIEPILL